MQFIYKLLSRIYKGEVKVAFEDIFGYRNKENPEMLKKTV